MCATLKRMKLCLNLYQNLAHTLLYFHTASLIYIQYFHTGKILHIHTFWLSNDSFFKLLYFGHFKLLYGHTMLLISGDFVHMLYCWSDIQLDDGNTDNLLGCSVLQSNQQTDIQTTCCCIVLQFRPLFICCYTGELSY